MNSSNRKTASLDIAEHLKDLQLFLKSTSFSRAIIVGIAVTLPIIIGIQTEHFEIGLAICFGAFWSSPSDVSGSFRQKKMGILISAAMVMVVAFIGGYLHYKTWISLPILGLLSFCIAYISIYGFRASLISFSGLLALVLSFAHDSAALEIYQYALLVGLGGLWYLLLAKIWNLIKPKADTEESLTETYELTAEFLEIRGQLIGPNEKNQQVLLRKLLNLQSQLTENHQKLREILILSRKSSGWSNYQDKRLLVFVQLVEMLETAVANPVNYDRMDALFKAHPHYIKLFQDLIFKMAEQLHLISKAQNNKNHVPKNDNIIACFNALQSEIDLLRENMNYEEYLMLQNFMEYQEKQFKKLKQIKRLLGNATSMETEFIDRKDAKRFVEPQNFDLKLLIRNFSFKSPIFRHSLRLSATIMMGYIIGSLFPFQNPYWILLTIIVIMRPSYGLTKSRAKDRIIGTFIGAVIATGMVFFIQNNYVYGAFGVASLVIAFSLAQKNSKVSAVFITLSVVFIYAILSPDILSVIKFRLLDTVVGAVMAYAAIYWLWPTWESVEIKESIAKSLEANRNFLKEITTYYQKKGAIPISYTLARKGAFVETSNLNSAFQRMAQEPKSKQNDMDKNYELVVLNHTFLASLASLSTFIQHHETTPASQQFKVATEKIEHNLKLATQCFNNRSLNSAKEATQNELIFTQQIPNFSTSTLNTVHTAKENIHNLQEAQLVWEQLQWLFSLSRKILKLSSKECGD